MPDPDGPLHLAIALDGAGWHPAAWREPDARPGDLFTPRYWVSLVQEAERGLADFVTIEDGLRLQSDHPLWPDDRTDRVRGRLDATLIAARVAPVTSNIGLVPTVIVNHTEPFHLSKAIATIDYASTGRARDRGRAQTAPGRTGRSGLHQRRRDLHRHPGRAGGPAAGLAAGRPVGVPAAARRPAPRPHPDHRSPGP
ncbi:MAG TPA: LLM class flavin-dependent oxidoreductase [Trebonia sp.]|nr:LLM class flavin-dependent oxidoreductase [Trebonia sp.]